MAPSQTSPTLFLHIGRNKAGSTTLQDFFASHAPWLTRSGVDYVLCGRLHEPGSGLRTLPEMADVLAEFHAGDRSMLVSDEMISAFPPEVSRQAAAVFRGVNVQVLLYVRPYRDWVRSSYGFDVRIGYNALDFDAYLKRIAASLSFWPNLQIWAEAVGWERIRVRSTDPGDLQGGTLVLDCLAAMGLQAPADEQPDRSNAMPNWMVVELLRLAASQHADGGWSFAGRAIAEALHELAEAAVAETAENAPASYLTSAQGLDLAAHYNRDLDLLAQHTGTRLQPDNAGHALERVFLPAARDIPQAVLRHIAAHASSADYARLHPEAAGFVASSAFTDLLVAGPAARRAAQDVGEQKERLDMSATTDRQGGATCVLPTATKAAETAYALAAGGDLHGAIASAMRALRESPDPALLKALARWRVDCFATMPPAAGPGQWPPALPDPFPGQIGIPCIDAAGLSAEVIGGAILHHGLLRVNGLLTADHAEQLRLGIETALAARDAYKETGDLDNDGWYAPVDVPMLAFKRDFVEKCGALWTADSPRMLYELIDSYSRIGLIDCIAEFMQEQPALSVRKSTLRRVPITTSTDWHQDGAFLGRKSRAVNVWLALSPCGIDAPGLDVVARRLPYIMQTGSHGSWFDWSVGTGLVDMLAEGGAAVMSPEFAPGDALLFDHMMLHRTGIRPEMKSDRWAIESWFFAPTDYPMDQVPLVV
jgi:hypothetical protein